MNNKISVIMGAYNCEKTLSDSLDSILKQTYNNWEFIICDDASTDHTLNILYAYRDKYPQKFKILKNEKNSKLAYSLNRCLEVADGTYIARMDADDISQPTRFQKQVNFLKEHENIDLVGTAMQRFNSEGLQDILTFKKFPDKYDMKKGNPFSHGTLVTYRYVYNELNGYKVSNFTQRVEDQELYFRFFKKGFKGANIKEPLYLVREDINAIKRRTPKSRFMSLKIRLDGYDLLQFPKKWYIKPIFLSTLKAIIPYKAQELYRKYQANEFRNINTHQK